MSARRQRASRQRGFTLLEVLITIIILSIGLLGLASLQSKVQISQVESYQRAQAVLLLQDMLARINANRAQAASYVTGPNAPLGYDGTPPVACNNPPGFLQDQCEWSNALKGAAESSAGGTAVGAMLGARGCIEVLQAQNAAPGVCLPGIYRVTVVWQGLNETVKPALECAEGVDFGGDGYRRAISAQTIIALNGCS